MNNVANSIVSIFSKKSPTILLTTYIMLFLFLWVLATAFMNWSIYIMYENPTKAEQNKQLMIITGVFNGIFSLILLCYFFYLIKFKIGPGGGEGLYNMYTLGLDRKIHENFWLFLLFFMVMANTVICFLAYVDYKEDSTSTKVKKMITSAASINTIIICGWLAYYLYLGTINRVTGLYKIVYEVVKGSPDAVKISHDFMQILEQKGQEMNLDLMSEVKDILVASVN